MFTFYIKFGTSLYCFWNKADHTAAKKQLPHNAVQLSKFQDEWNVENCFCWDDNLRISLHRQKTKSFAYRLVKTAWSYGSVSVEIVTQYDRQTEIQTDRQIDDILDDTYYHAYHSWRAVKKNLKKNLTSRTILRSFQPLQTLSKKLHHILVLQRAREFFAPALNWLCKPASVKMISSCCIQNQP